MGGMRYSIRDALWLVSLIAVLCAWSVDHLRLGRKCHRAEQAAYALLMFNDAEGKGYVTFPDGTRWP